MSTNPWLPQDDLAARRPSFDEELVESESRLSRLLAAIRIERRHLKAVGLILSVAAIASIWLLSQSRTHEVRLPAVKPSAVKSPLDFSVPTPSGQDVVVDVAGRVRHPGVYKLVAGSRAVDAVAAAGGVLPGTDMTTINLAQHVEDGDQIIVGAEVARPAGGPANRLGKLNLNSATVQDLDALPGVGPVLAARIIAWRHAHGRFKTIEDLRKVSGVGDAKFGDLRPLVRT